MGGELCLVHSWLLMADDMFNGGQLVLCQVDQSIPGQDCQLARVKFWFTNSFYAAEDA